MRLAQALPPSKSPPPPQPSEVELRTGGVQLGVAFQPVLEHRQAAVLGLLVEGIQVLQILRGWEGGCAAFGAGAFLAAALGAAFGAALGAALTAGAFLTTAALAAAALGAAGFLAAIFISFYLLIMSEYAYLLNKDARVL